MLSIAVRGGDADPAADDGIWGLGTWFAVVGHAVSGQTDAGGEEEEEMGTSRSRGETKQPGHAAGACQSGGDPVQGDPDIDGPYSVSAVPDVAVASCYGVDDGGGSRVYGAGVGGLSGGYVVELVRFKGGRRGIGENEVAGCAGLCRWGDVLFGV